MQWSKSPPELIARFEDAAPEDPRVVRRLMFGYPALYLNGNMFAGTYQDKVYVRLGERERDLATEAGADPFEPMPGRVMKEYVVLPPQIVADAGELARWIVRARDYASTLAPKETRGKRPASRSSRSAAGPRDTVRRP